MPDNWSEHERHKVAEKLLRDFPNLSIDKLLAAIRACEHEATPAEGWEKLADCTRTYLKKSGGTGEK